MRLHADPPLSQWSPRRAEVDRTALIKLINCNAERGLGAPWAESVMAPIIATGHQPALWHPGILAKYMSVREVATTQHTASFHLIVDHDAHDALALQLPVCRDDRLAVHDVAWPFPSSSTAGVPTGATPAVDTSSVISTLQRTRDELGDALAADVQPLLDAWRDLPHVDTLAEQVALVLARLWRPYVGGMPVLFVSQFIELPAFRERVTAMRDHAHACATAFNAAVAAHPHAGIAPMSVATHRIELPLWLMRTGEARQRVWADVTSERPLLVADDGRAIEIEATDRGRIVPRAITLSAFMRAWACDLFVRGVGGETYDAVTDAWWRQWRGEVLPPAATVTADVTLSFNAPVADDGDLRRATWWAHHLPHNVDRYIGPEGDDAPLIARKHDLLAHMSDDRDRARRSAAFAELHGINEQLAARHVAALDEARQRVDRARAGVANRAIAAKRDWCFALYPPDRLAKLDTSVRNAAAAAHTMPA